MSIFTSTIANWRSERLKLLLRSRSPTSPDRNVPIMPGKDIPEPISSPASSPPNTSNFSVKLSDNTNAASTSENADSRSPIQVSVSVTSTAAAASETPTSDNKESGSLASIITQVSQTPLLPAIEPPPYIPPPPVPGTYIPLLPPMSADLDGKNTLVLDLDETLVHSSFKPLPFPDFTVEVMLDQELHMVSVRKRPFVDEFLVEMRKIYEVVILTASLAIYADQVLDKLDTTKTLLHHRLFRDACASYNGSYIKDLSYLGRPVHKVIIIDNSPVSYMFQPRNAIPVTSWFDDNSDTELRDMVPLLKAAATSEDVYSVLDKHRMKGPKSPTKTK